jgi:hypothetical protein
MSNLALKIEPSDYSGEIKLVRIKIAGYNFNTWLQNAKKLTTHIHYDGEEELERVVFEDKTGRSFWFDITGDELVIHGYFSHEGDDRLDGTLPEPTEPSLDDRLKLATLIKRLIG